MNNKHLMIDLETLGRKPGCVILQAGLVIFDEDEIYFEKRLHADLASAMERRMKVEPETLKWWLSQPTAVIPEKGSLKYDSFLRTFLDSWHQYPISTVWANSPSFDLELLKYYFQESPYALPWAYYQERDVRTIKALLPKGQVSEIRGEKHNALHDALHQVDLVQFFMRKHQLKIS